MFRETVVVRGREVGRDVLDFEGWDDELEGVVDGGLKLRFQLID